MTKSDPVLMIDEFLADEFICDLFWNFHIKYLFVMNWTTLFFVVVFTQYFDVSSKYTVYFSSDMNES